MNSYYEHKIGRIKLKINSNISIYDIFIYKLLSDTTEKIYLYIDDRIIGTASRSSGIGILQKKINEMLHILTKFNLKLPDKIIKYTDYYATAWIYLHRLVQKNEALLNYNVVHKNDDLQTILFTNKVKIFLVNTLDTNNIVNDRYNFILYDNGWFREIFIETIMDDAEQVTYILDERYMDNSSNMSKVNKLLATKLKEVLKFNYAHAVLTNISETIEKLKTTISAYPTINDFTVDQIISIGMNFQQISEMIEKQDITLKNRIINCIDLTNDNPDDNSEFVFNKKCLIDPVKIRMNEERIVDIDNVMVKVENVYLDYADFYSSIRIENDDVISIKIKYIGHVQIKKDNESITGVWTKADKKKKRKTFVKSIVLTNSQSVINEYIFSKTVSALETHRLIFNDIETVETVCNSCLFKIKSQYYVRSNNNEKHLIEIY
jgi:hypothetical protein